MKKRKVSASSTLKKRTKKTNHKDETIPQGPESVADIEFHTPHSEVSQIEVPPPPHSDVIRTEFHTPKMDSPDITIDAETLTKGIKKKNRTEEEEFVSLFYDYPDFIRFVETEVCGTSSDCFCDLLTSTTTTVTKPKSHFLLSLFSSTVVDTTKEFDYTVFTTRAPEGYSLYSAINRQVLSGTTPFFDAMKEIFKIIPHLEPSKRKEGNRYSVHRYMLILDRLIYFYNVYLLQHQSKLKGFSNTAAFVVYTHGAYPIYNVADRTSIKEVRNPVENMFVCYKSAPGCVAREAQDQILKEVSDKGSYLWTMTNGIKTKGFVNFDEVAFPDYKCPVKNSSSAAGCCFAEVLRRGNSMEHYIGPNTKKYIDKMYYTNVGEHDYVIDLNEFDKVSESKTLDPVQKITASAVTLTDFLKARMTPKYKGTVLRSYSFRLSDLMDYASEVLGKTNVFIYDRSCGVTLPIMVDSSGTSVLPPIETIIPLVEGYSREGLGKKSSRRGNKANRTRNKRIRKTRRHHRGRL